MIIEKDPSARLEYGFDWVARGWLGDDTIAVSTWDVPTGLVKEDEETASGRCVVWLSGGEVGQTYRVTNHIVTVAGREDDRSLTIRVSQR